jgi:CubicO group peptidase (beta-lactamase class C family)
MKRRPINFLLPIVLLCCFNNAKAQDSYDRMDSLFNAVSHSGVAHFNGSMVVAENGKIIYQKSGGYADIDKKMLNSAATNFSLASLSKVFTAIAVMQLKEGGKIYLDDPLQRYLPDFPFPDITIRQVLSHTSGLPDFEIFESYRIETNNKQFTGADIIPALKKSRLVSVPGAEWHYSSVGYGLLALLVEKVSKQSFQQYIKENICRPAGLTNTYVDNPGSNMPDTLKAILYPDTPSGFTSADSLKINKTDPIQTIVGPGLIRSSINDLLKFDAALYANKLLNKESKEEMFVPVTLNDGAYAQLEHAPLYNALGWGVDIDSSAGKIVSHTGGSPGIATIMLRNLSKKQTVIILENTDNRLPIPMAVNMMNLLNHKPFEHFRMD